MLLPPANTLIRRLRGQETKIALHGEDDEPSGTVRQINRYKRPGAVPLFRRQGARQYVFAFEAQLGCDVINNLFCGYIVYVPHGSHPFRCS